LKSPAERVRHTEHDGKINEWELADLAGPAGWPNDLDDEDDDENLITGGPCNCFGGDHEAVESSEAET
jgi:hypothetical protein